MSEDKLIDIQWDRAEKYARNFAFRHFEFPNPARVKKLKINIFEYLRKRDLKRDYHEFSSEEKQYCFHCLAMLPKFHFCIK